MVIPFDAKGVAGAWAHLARREYLRMMLLPLPFVGDTVKLSGAVLCPL